MSNTQPVIRIGSSIGVGTFELDNDCFSTAHIEWDVYLNGLGTRSRSPGCRRQVSMDLFAALTLTAKIGDYNVSPYYYKNPTWNQPLYYWSDFSQQPLQNPYWNSFSFGPVWAFAIDRKKRESHSFVQRIGFTDLHINQFDLSYCNDGGSGIKQSKLGAGKDRLYTGCGHVSYHPKSIDGINSYELSFHKFTGYTCQAFELSCDLNLGYVDYKDSYQQYYSRSELCFRAGSTIQGWSATLRWINPKNRKEIQNLIHYFGDFAQHQISYPSGFALGGDFSPFFTNIYLK